MYINLSISVMDFLSFSLVAHANRFMLPNNPVFAKTFCPIICGTKNQYRSCTNHLHSLDSVYYAETNITKSAI